MLSMQNSLVKQTKAKEPQAFQRLNKQANTFHEGMDSSMYKSIQLKYKGLAFQPNPKLLAIQRMAENFDQKKNIQLKKNNSGLPDNLKNGVESLSGLSMDDVKVHYNSDKPAQLNAHAYAQGTDIHLASGQEKHLPHEAWHVVQQKQGRVRPTMMMKAKVPINDDQGLEKEADVMGARALQMKPFSLSDYNTEHSVQRKGVVQKVGGEEEEDVMEVNSFGLRGTIDGDQDAKADAESAVKEEKWEAEIDDFEKRKEDDKESQGTSKYGWAEYHPDSPPKLDSDGNEIEKFDEEFIDSPWFSASVGIEKVEATKIEMQQHKGIKKAFHVTTLQHTAASVLNKIDHFFDNPASRFGGGFYVASDIKTCYAEIAAHEDDQFKDPDNKNPKKQSAVHAIEYDVTGGDLADCTGGELVEMVKSDPLAIEKKVREDKRDGIVFPSTKGSGNNIVLFRNFGILNPKSKEPTSAKEGFEQFKKEKASEK